MPCLCLLVWYEKSYQKHMDVHNAYEPWNTKNPQKTKEWNSRSGLTIQSQQYLLTANENISSIWRGKKGKHSQILLTLEDLPRHVDPKSQNLFPG